MANLKDLIVRGVSRFIGKIYATDIEASGNITATNLGAAAAKGVVTTVTSDGTDLPTAGAVYTAIQDAGGGGTSNFVPSLLVNGDKTTYIANQNDSSVASVYLGVSNEGANASESEFEISSTGIELYTTGVGINISGDGASVNLSASNGGYVGIHNLNTPVNSSDAATKGYVDATAIISASLSISGNRITLTTTNGLETSATSYIDLPVYNGGVS